MWLPFANISLKTSIDTLINSCILSRLDYCTSLLAGYPRLSNHSNKYRTLQPKSSLSLVERNPSNLFSSNCTGSPWCKITCLWDQILTGNLLNGEHRTCAETAAVSPGTSHATTKERYQYTTCVDTDNMRYKRTQSFIQNHVRHVRSESAREQRLVLYLKKKKLCVRARVRAKLCMRVFYHAVYENVCNFILILFF